MIEYTYQDVIINFKQNWKGMVCIIFICSLIGIICGGINIKRLEKMEYSRDDTIIELIDLSDLPRDEAYYEKAFNRIKNMRYALRTYVVYLKQAPMSGASMTKISEMEKWIIAYEDTYQELVDRYNCVFPMIVTDNSMGYVDEKIYIIKNRIELYESQLNQIGEYFFVGGISKEEKLELENVIDDLYKDVFYYENLKKRLQSTNSEIKEYDNRLFDEVLSLNLTKINELVHAFNKLIEELEAVEQYDIVYNKYLLKGYTVNIKRDIFFSDEDVLNIKRNEALIYAKSISGVDSVEESFLAYMLFFEIFGIVCAILYGAFRKRIYIQS